MLKLKPCFHQRYSKEVISNIFFRRNICNNSKIEIAIEKQYFVKRVRLLFYNAKFWNFCTYRTKYFNFLKFSIISLILQFNWSSFFLKHIKRFEVSIKPFTKNFILMSSKKCKYNIIEMNSHDKERIWSWLISSHFQIYSFLILQKNKILGYFKSYNLRKNFTSPFYFLNIGPNIKKKNNKLSSKQFYKTEIFFFYKLLKFNPKIISDIFLFLTTSDLLFFQFLLFSPFFYIQLSSLFFKGNRLNTGLRLKKLFISGNRVLVEELIFIEIFFQNFFYSKKINYFEIEKLENLQTGKFNTKLPLSFPIRIWKKNLNNQKMGVFLRKGIFFRGNLSLFSRFAGKTGTIVDLQNDLAFFQTRESYFKINWKNNLFLSHIFNKLSFRQTNNKFEKFETTAAFSENIFFSCLILENFPLKWIEYFYFKILSYDKEFLSDCYHILFASQKIHDKLLFF